MDEEWKSGFEDRLDFLDEQEGWDDQEPELQIEVHFWNPRKPEEPKVIRGIFIGEHTYQNKQTGNSFQKYHLQTKEGVIAFQKSKFLDDRMGNVSKGDLLELEFTGIAPVKDHPERNYNTYNVRMKKVESTFDALPPESDPQELIRRITDTLMAEKKEITSRNILAEAYNAMMAGDEEMTEEMFDKIRAIVEPEEVNEQPGDY